jgi:hypothetical protein
MSRENKRKEVRYSELNRLTVAISAVSEKKCECGSIVREDFFSFFLSSFHSRSMSSFSSFLDEHIGKRRRRRKRKIDE